MPEMTIKTMPNFTVYCFPSLGGSPRDFDDLAQAVEYGKQCYEDGLVPELKNNVTGEYKAYWRPTSEEVDAPTNGGLFGRVNHWLFD